MELTPYLMHDKKKIHYFTTENQDKENKQEKFSKKKTSDKKCTKIAHIWCSNAVVAVKRLYILKNHQFNLINSNFTVPFYGSIILKTL